MEGRVRFMLTLVLPLLWKVARGQLDACKPKTVDVDDNLELHCDCEVDPDVVINVQWFKFEEQRDQFLPYQSTITERDADERNLKFESVNVSVGGVYKCTCDSSSPQCFDVTVKVHIVNFDAEPDVVRVNESFTLTCIAVGFPRPTGFQLTKDDNLRIELTELIHLKNGVYHRVVARNKDYDGNYTCLVYNSESTDVADKEVTVYEPPRIVGVKNFTFSDAALQHTAVLECAIENRTTTACVQWIRSNTIITPSEKYRTDVVKRGRGLLIFALTVRDLSESDIGEYLCRLSSEYNDTEGSANAFIHSPSPTQLPPGETPGGTVPDDKEEDNQSAAITGTGVAIAFIAIVIFGVVACVALIYCRNFRHHGTGNADHTSSTPGGVVSTPGDSTSTTPIPPFPSTFSVSSSHPSEVSLSLDSETGADVTLGASTTELHNQQEPTERKKFDFDDLRLRKGSYKTPPASPHANILPRN